MANFTFLSAGKQQLRKAIDTWRTELFRRSDDPQVVLQPTDHGSCDGHGALARSRKRQRAHLTCRWIHKVLRECTILHLQCVTGRFVPPEFVGYSGQKAVVGHDGLRKTRDIVSGMVGFIRVLEIQIFENAPWLRCFAGESSRSRTWHTRGRKSFVESQTHNGGTMWKYQRFLRVFGLSVLETHLSNKCSWLIPKALPFRTIYEFITQFETHKGRVEKTEKYTNLPLKWEYLKELQISVRN